MHRDSCEVSRRDFLKTGTAVTVAAAGLSGMAAFASEESASVLPTRKLGKTGVEVTILNLGTANNMDIRLFNTAWSEGVRYIDTADCYKGGHSEKLLGQWLSKTGRRKDIFVVTKDHPQTPDEWVGRIDARLEALQTDYVDLFFLHMLGGDTVKKDLGILKDKSWAQAANTLKKSGKVKFVGFSSHSQVDVRTALLNNAAEGWVDAAMVASGPSLVRDNRDFNRALDKCHQAGVGLICMKEMRGVEKIPQVVPEFEKMGLTKHAAMLYAVWTDERFSSICSAMPTVKIIKENSASARNFKPLTKDQMGMLDQVMRRYASTFCVGCDGRCRQAAGSEAALGEIARYLSYYEVDGDRETARRLFRSLPAPQRDWSSADLKAASRACVCNLDFEELLARAKTKLA